MKLERISLQRRDDSVRTFELHRGLTVIEAEPGGARPLASALVGALSTGGDGIHVEFSLDDGAELVAFRPYGGAHRVLDVASSTDLTARFRRGTAGVDVLAPWRSAQPAGAQGAQRALPGPQVPERQMLVSADELAPADPTEEWIARLSLLDVDRLLDAADEEVRAESDLRHAAATARATPAHAAAITGLEATRAEVRRARRRHDRFRLVTVVAGTTLPVVAIIGLHSLGVGAAVTLIAASLLLTVGCLVHERRLARMLAREQDAEDAAALDDGGARHLDRTSTGAAPAGADLLAASERYRSAAAAWQELAGNVPAPWVQAQRERVRRIAQLRSAVAPDELAHLRSLPPEPRSASLIAGLTGRVADHGIEHGPNESLPLVLDEPLAGLSWAEKASVLEFLGRLSDHHQVLVVTADEEVLSWARLEAMAGTIGAIVGAPTAPDGRSPEDALRSAAGAAHLGAPHPDGATAADSWDQPGR